MSDSFASSAARKVRFSLHIPGDVYLAYYQGAARAVVVRTADGRTVQFPAEALRPFVTRDGIHGAFEMEFDAHNKLLDLRRVDE